ncbi:PAS domain-containing sensor histidine kinase [Cognatishimia sp. MH4019]|uniref:sensor histidine kinase NtrY-like n=1 Tax=Cognatishimia sp. MH4019 TaxID=2854030 RepID=UPI001CD37F41|nr:PAS domain-containing sensor histidine kinase [Cognatishimia sp. MH4019]
MALQQRSVLDRLSRFRRRRRVQNAATLGLVLLGPILTLLTFLALGPLDMGATSPSLRLILIADLVYVLVVATLVAFRIARMIAARRARSAGSRLHLRLTSIFASVALIPTVLVAIFAGLTLNVGIEGWFSDRVREVVGSSLAAAEAYEEEQRVDLTEDARALAQFMNITRRQSGVMAASDVRRILAQGQAQIQRGLREAYIIDSDAEIRARGERSYLFDFEAPSRTDIDTARDTGLLIIADWDNNEFRALVPLTAFLDRFLYVSRTVDGDILNLLDETQETAAFYNQLEQERGRIFYQFGLIYLGFAVILILAAIWLGLWFAERLSRPIGALAGAAQQVGTGNLDMRVREEEGDDEIAMLGRYFNQMTEQLKGQRETLLDNTRQIERRRRLFDSVLTSVTSGVIGLDENGKVTFVNRSAERLLDWDADQEARPLSVAVPEFGPLLERLREAGSEVAQQETRLTRNGKMENLLVRVSTRRREDGSLEGYVVAFDDVTDLVSAQRMAAWGDVARRIAHEIKNPLTPIQLSAERIKRKFRKEVEDADQLDQMTEVIVRQTNDLRRIVDEFSKFARMPEPDRRDHDLTALVRGAVLLQDAGQETVTITADLPETPVVTSLDDTMISQALTNLIKNAGEAIDGYKEKTADPDYDGQIQVSLTLDAGKAHIRIADNGIGLPADRSRLFEPYVTTRSEGTGLGLPIVKKIIEEHGGTLTLDDAPLFENDSHAGAQAHITLPVSAARDASELKQEETV